MWDIMKLYFNLYVTCITYFTEKNSFFFNFHLKFFPDKKSDMTIFQCYSETLGSASVKSDLCPFILHLYMKNVTAKKI